MWKQLVAGIHASRRQSVLAITGGGSQAIGNLLSVPGGSHSLLEAVVPYSHTSLIEFLGGEPDQACSEPTARALAMAAWMRARKLGADPHLVVGVGATASLVSDIPKRGEHRIHVGMQTATETNSYSLTLVKGQRTRQQEERLAAKLLILALGELCKADTETCRTRFESKLLDGEQIQHRLQQAHPEWTKLLLGEQSSVAWQSDSGKDLPTVLFPGAFNPLHQGHLRMAEVAAELTKSKVCYEISIMNVDKPPLDFVEIATRIAGIERKDPKRNILLTAAPTFKKKADLAPGLTFVVGADTLQRIADPCYYGNNAEQRDQAIRQIANADGRFLVFGRQMGGKFCLLRDLRLPSELIRLCQEVPEEYFRENISSTELRK